MRQMQIEISMIGVILRSQCRNSRNRGHNELALPVQGTDTDAFYYSHMLKLYNKPVGEIHVARQRLVVQIGVIVEVVEETTQATVR